MRRVVVSVTMSLLVLAVLAASAPAQRRPSILFVNSYHNGYSWSDNILQGLREALQAEGVDADLRIEYLDAKRTSSEAVRRAVFELLRTKYGTYGFDVVVVSDNDAFHFALEHRQELFPEAPVVFCGVNDLELGSVEGLPLTGVLENADIRSTLKVAFSVHSQVRQVVVIGDDSVTGRAIRHQVQQASAPFLDRAEFDYWREASLQRILERLPSLSEETLVYFIPSYYELGGQLLDPGEVLELLHEASPRPIYSSWAFLLGHGIVGGRMASGLEQGRQAGQLVVRILNGEAAASIPLVQETENPFQFDYLRMQEFGIHEAELPPGSRIVNAPQAFYEVSKDLLWTLVVSFVLLGLALVMLAVNILRRKRIEAKIINQLSFQELLMDTIPQLVCWKDEKQRYLGANRSFARFFGVDDPAELIEKTDYHIMDQGHFTEWFAAMDREVLHSRNARLRQRISLENREGEQVWLEVNKVPLHDAQGNVVGTLSTAEDVTREINLERQLLQSQKMEAIGALAGGVAHDFNNILTSIINSTELALGDLEEDSDTAVDLRRVLKASERGRRLVQQILAFSRPSQEGFRPTDLSELVRDTLAFLQPSLPRNISIRAEITQETQKVLVDPTQMYQVLMNLCTNAFQAMREEGGELWVSLERLELPTMQADILDLPPGPCYRLTVADTGPGIDQGLIDKIFDPFFTTKGKKEGTGLGLAVVLGIVKNHGGAVRVDSAPGKGATFEIYVPARPAEPEAAELPRQKAEQGQGRILFVEDDEDQLATIPRVLQGLGYEVQAAAGPKAAMELLQTGETFDLVVTDYDMPEANGVTLARLVAQKRPGVPVIMVSGRSQAREHAKSSENIITVLPKPFSKSDLAEAVRSALS